MTDTVWDPTGEAQQVLASAVAEEGPNALSNPNQLNNLLRDLLPDQPREASLIVAAAQLDVRRMLGERLASGADVGTAIRLSAATLAQGRAFDPSACQWVVSEFAIALGHKVAPVDRSGWPTGPVAAPACPPLLGAAGDTPVLGKPAPFAPLPQNPPAEARAEVTPVLAPRAPAVQPSWGAPPAPPTPPPIQFAPPPIRTKSGRGPLVAVLSVVALIVIVAVVGGVLLLDRHSTAPRATPGSQPPTSPTDVTSATSSQGLGTSTTMVTTTTAPNPGDLVSLAAGVSGPDVAGVRQALGTYFGDINDHDWQGAWATFTPSMQASISPAQIAQHSASTQDSGVVLTALTNSAGADVADVSFTSTQLPADSPNGAACDRWTLDYGLTFNGTVWLLESVSSVNGASYSSC